MAEPVRDPTTSTPRPRRKRLGEMLVDQGVITGEQLAEVLGRQKREKGSRMGRLLVDPGSRPRTWWRWTSPTTYLPSCRETWR
jgi:hypothetical protein